MSELIVPTINFSMLVALLGYFVWPVFKKQVASRSEVLEKLIQEARQKKLEAEAKFREYEGKLQTLEKDVERILSQAQKDAEEIKKSIIENAEKSAAGMTSNTEAFVKAGFNSMKEELRKEAIRIAVNEAEKVLKARLSQDVHKKIIKDCLEEVQ